jgi:hypothetical protein
VVGATETTNANGVLGYSPLGVGVLGTSNSGSGVKGTSTGFDAVVGQTSSDAHAGVTGRNSSTGANGGVGIYGVGGKFAGKFDGTLQVNGDANVSGGQLAVTAKGGQQALVVNGPITHVGDFSTTGTLTVDKDIILSASDCAEEFDVGTAAAIEPGTVMVLDDSGTLQPSEHAYDKKVAGVISGAGDYKPGLILGRATSLQKRMPLALVGKIYCKVDAHYAPVEVGDLLTTSPTLGHAMRAADPLKAFGAVIGKALRPLRSGQGLVPILIALQ